MYIYYASENTFNRTILELKQRCICLFVFTQPTFNRTILELKLPGWSATDYAYPTFNRTILELKLQYCIKFISNLLHLIEPSWN